jgi:pimeloyl-ACP methyl ester carboxylesterase
MNASDEIKRLRAFLPRPVLPPLWREAGAIREGLNVIRESPRPPLRELPRSRTDVLLVPGFLAGDSSMRLLARFLERSGYQTVPSGIVRNVDCSEVTVRRLESLLERHDGGRSRLAVVGHSRGGLLARVLARRRPDLVAGVVMLGSPVRDQLAVHPLLWVQIFGIGIAGSAGMPNTLTVACADGPCCRPFRADLEARLPDTVPLLSLYSRRDGLVDWRSCRDRDGDNVEVAATHIGMIAHAQTFRIVLQALDRIAGSASTPLSRPASHSAGAAALAPAA